KASDRVTRSPRSSPARRPRAVASPSTRTTRSPLAVTSLFYRVAVPLSTALPTADVAAPAAPGVRPRSWLAWPSLGFEDGHGGFGHLWRGSGETLPAAGAAIRSGRPSSSRRE